jgi:hypothetical protein
LGDVASERRHERQAHRGCIQKLKDSGRITTHYDKLARNCLASVCLVGRYQGIQFG